MASNPFHRSGWLRYSVSILLFAAAAGIRERFRGTLENQAPYVTPAESGA